MDSFLSQEIGCPLNWGNSKGLVALGFNPLLAGPDVPRLLRAMANLQWEVVIDPVHAGFRGVLAGHRTSIPPAPSPILAAGPSGRSKPSTPPDGVRSDTWILSELFWRVKELYEEEGGAYHEPILNLQWNYLNQREPHLEELAAEINGSDLQTGELLSSFGQLRDDGTTSSGNWLYTGSFTEEGNMMARRGTDDPSGMGFHHDWAFSWPLNRRVLYNRASADGDGRPWDGSRAGIRWTGERWIG